MVGTMVGGALKFWLRAGIGAGLCAVLAMTANPAQAQLGDILTAPKTLVDRAIEARSAADIKRIREEAHVSQPVFARYLNTSESTVQKWEAGTKRPSGMALKLLAVVEKHGLKVLA